AVVEAHLASCAACRTELERSRKLEKVLRSVPSGALPDEDRFVASLRARSRRPAPARWAVAAAVLIAIPALSFFVLRREPVDVRAELVKYSVKPTADIENRIRSTGPAGLAQLEGALDDREIKIQFSAAALLFKLSDDQTRERVLSR